MTEHHSPQRPGHASTTRTGGRLLTFCLATAVLVLAACSNGSTRSGQDASASAGAQAPAGISTVPVMLPFPVDKAGHELRTEFWVSPPKKGQLPAPHYVGLRMLFTAGDPDGHVRFIRDGNPITVKVDLRHIDGDKEVPVVLARGSWVNTGPGPFDKKLEVSEMLDGVTTTRGNHSAHSELPRGTTNGMYYQMSLGGAGALAPGRYRLQAQVLHDQPRLVGVPMFLTVRESEHSK